MAAPAEVINKINALNANDLVLVTNLVEHLSKAEASGSDGPDIFRRAREACKDSNLSEDDVEKEIELHRAEKHAART